MKSCLIVAAPRSGSSNLMRSIAKGNNLKVCFEPFGSKKDPRDLKIDGHCTKAISKRRTIEFWEKLSKKFDKVVLQARRDIKAQAESYVKLRLTKGPGNPDMKWIELNDHEKTFLPIGIEQIEEAVFIIEELSKRMNIPIDYYEDIYTNYTLNDKSIKLDKSFLDPSRKCRVNKIYAI